MSVTVQNLSTLQSSSIIYYYNLRSFRSKSKREEKSLVFAWHPRVIERIVLPSFSRAIINPLIARLDDAFLEVF